MMSDITIIGEPLFTEDTAGKLKSRIATVFPRFHAIVTLPGIHATQIQAFVERLIGQQLPAGFPQTPEEKERAARDDAVALTIEGDTVHIRPDPENMPLAFLADSLCRHRIQAADQVPQRPQREGPQRGQAAGRMLADRLPPMSPKEMKQRIRHLESVFAERRSTTTTAPPVRGF